MINLFIFIIKYVIGVALVTRIEFTCFKKSRVLMKNIFI